MVEMITQVNNAINGVVWGPFGLALLFCTGFWMSARTGFFQFRKMGYWLRHTIGAIFTNKDITGKDAEHALDAAGITVNKNTVPFETRSPFVTSGIRLGTPAITTRGAKEDLMELIAELIEQVLNSPEDPKVIAAVRARVNETMEQYPLFYDYSQE